MLKERLKITKTNGYKFAEKKSETTVTEPEKKVPVAGEVDVIVVGAGTSGLFAGLAAARKGARTVLIDRFGMLGGNIGPSMIYGGSIVAQGYPDAPEGGMMLPKGVSGIAKEFVDRMRELSAAGQFDFYDRNRANRNYADEGNISSYLGMKMADECGLELLLSVYAADPIVAGKRVTGLFVEGKSGRVAIKAPVVIDATGDASLAERAGAPMIHHVKPDPAYKIMVHEKRLRKDFAWWNETGLTCLVGGVDFERYHRAEKPAKPLQQYGEEVGMFKVGLKGQFEHHSMLQMSAIEEIVRKQAFERVLAMRKEITGCEQAYLLATGWYLGGRGGAFIEGEHVLTLEEAYEGKEFDDVMYRIIFRRGHTPGYNKKGLEVPYRILLPKGIDGLLVAARGASYIRRGHDGPGTRVRLSMMVLGEAAGTAAALAVKNKVAPKTLDVKLLQKELLAAGIYVGSRQRLEQLGIGQPVP